MFYQKKGSEEQYISLRRLEVFTNKYNWIYLNMLIYE